MRIGVVTASYPRSEGDHAGNFVAAHVAAMRAAGHEVEVIGAHTITSELFDRGGAPDELERGGLRTYLAAARFSTQLTREVSRRAGSWELVVAHWLVPSAMAATVATRGIPILAIAHGGDIHTLRRMRLLAPTLYALRARGARLAFVSSGLREHARRAAPRLSRWLDESIVQPMGIDTARFDAIRAARTTRNAPPRVDATNASDDVWTNAYSRGVDSRHVVVVARLVPVKGVDVAIRALLATRTNVRLTIAGDGPERAALEDIARNDARIRFVGTVDAHGLDDLLREADALVIPSRVLPNGRSEGTPMIASEALAAGVPVIASAVGGLGDLGGITLVRPDAPLALAVAIDRVLESPPIPTAPDALAWKSVAARLFEHAGKNPICESRDTSSTASGRRTA